MYEEKGLKRPDFARSLDISYDRLLAYETGKTEPSPEFFRRVGEAYPESDLVWLLTGEGRLQIPNYEIPILATIHAGNLTEFLADEDVIGYWTPRKIEPGMFALRVEGDSMHPEIQQGDLAICSPSLPFLNGAIYAVGTKEYSYTLKRVFKRNEGYDLVPSNPNFATSFLPEGDLVQAVRVIEIVRSL